MEASRKQSYEIRVVLTNRENAWDLFWIKVRSREVQCGISTPSYGYHSSFHQSGEIRISEEPSTSPAQDDVPAIAQVGSGNWKRKPLEQLGNAERIAAFALPVDEENLQDFPSFQKRKRYDHVVYVDGFGLSKPTLGIEIWVARPNQFFQRVHGLPGFRHILALEGLWLVVDVELRAKENQKP